MRSHSNSRLVPRRSLLRGAAGIGALALLGTQAGTALAAYADKTIRLVVPFPPGGAGDLMARGLAQRLSTDLGQQVIIDNRGDAGGAPAAEMVANAAPDGYTLFFGTMGTHAINPALYAKLRYDPQRDFTPIALTHINPRVLVVGPSMKARTVAELIAAAKAAPEPLTYGSAGSGSSSHLAGALFESQAGVKLLHVPYKGSGPLLTDLLAGRVDMAFDSWSVYEGHIKAGKVHAIAVTSRTRMGVAPQLPTLAESGLPGYDIANWLGVFAPAHTDPNVVKVLNVAIGRALAEPDLRAQLVGQGIEPTFSTPEAFAALVQSELPKWAAIVKKSGATAD